MPISLEVTTHWSDLYNIIAGTSAKWTLLIGKRSQYPFFGAISTRLIKESNDFHRPLGISVRWHVHQTATLSLSWGVAIHILSSPWTNVGDAELGPQGDPGRSLTSYIGPLPISQPSTHPRLVLQKWAILHKRRSSDSAGGLVGVHPSGGPQWIKRSHRGSQVTGGPLERSYPSNGHTSSPNWLGTEIFINIERM